PPSQLYTLSLHDALPILVYAVMFSPSDWLMLSLVAPEGQPLLGLDETLVQPLIGSLDVLDETAPASSPLSWPTLTPEAVDPGTRSEEHTSELQSRENLVC